jgi:branched-chain amino acid transport system ATP-binding protein
MAEQYIFTIENLGKAFGKREVLKNIWLAFFPGAKIGVIGSNGAGKSTLLKALAGILRPVSGSIVFDGEEISKLPAHRVVSRGIVLVPEGRRLFADQTVLDNLLLGSYRRGDKDSGVPARARAEGYLEQFPVLRERRDRPAGALSGGQQQMLAISRGLMARPRLLLLDEPSLGLAPLLVRQVFDTIAELRRQGMTILLVEQLAKLALRLADRAYVLVQGRITLHGTSEQLLNSAEIVRGYLGRGSGGKTGSAAPSNSPAQQR